MNNTKNITKRMMSKQKTMLGVISNAIKNNMRTSALVLGLMGFPMFSSMAEGGGDHSIPVTVSATTQDSSQELLTTLEKEIGEIKKTLSEKKILIDENSKSGLYSDSMIKNCLTNPMGEALLYSKNARGSNIQSLELVNKILPSFKDLATLISDKVEPLKLTKDNLEDEKVKELLNTMRISITNLLKDYTKKDSDFDVLQKWFLQKLRSDFYAIDNNSGSNLLKDSDFRTGLTNIRNKLAEDFKIDDIKVKQSPEEELATALTQDIKILCNTLSENSVISKNISCKLLFKLINNSINKQDKTENDIKALSNVNKILPLFNKLIKTLVEGVNTCQIQDALTFEQQEYDVINIITTLKNGIRQTINGNLDLTETLNTFRCLNENFINTPFKDNIKNKMLEVKEELIKIFYGTKLENQYIHLSIQKSEKLFNDIEHKVIGIDLGTKNVVFTSNEFAAIKIIEDIYSSKICPAIKIAATLEKTFSEGTKVLPLGLQSTADIPGLIKEYYEECQSNSDHTKLKSVEGYNYLTQLEYKKGRNCIVPIQDMATEIDINNPSEYGKKQIFGIMLQAKRHFTTQYSDKKDRLKSDGKTVDLNLTFNDQVPEKNKEIIAAIYAEVYAEEFLKGDLSKINVSYINQSDAAITTYLYENYTNKLQAITNHDKLVVLDLGQSGLRMKGLMGTDQEIQITKSKAYQNISGDLIDQAIWDVFKEKVAQEIGKSKDIDLTYEKAKNLVETNLSLKSKCLNEINKAKEKLSADGASSVNVSIDDVYDDEGVEFVFSVEDINAALDKANLIETFKNDIQNGVKEMYGADNTKGIKFAIVGGSLRIDYLKKVVAELVTGKEIKDKAMISANLIQTLNMDESPAYGAAYTSLLENEYKNALSKKVDSGTILSIKNDQNLKEIKSELDKLVNSGGNYQKCAELRNAIEATCYAIQNSLTDSKIYTKVDNIIKTLHNKNGKLANDQGFLTALKDQVDTLKDQVDTLKDQVDAPNSASLILSSLEKISNEMTTQKIS